MLYQRRFADMPSWPTFLASYQAAGFANDPSDPGLFGPLAYDAANIIVAAIDRANSTNPVAIRNEIAATSNFAGVVGTYVGFDAKGDVIPQWSSMWRYLSGEWWRVYPFAVFLPNVLKN
jgi:ABC-type branched-subunit amino acid transport system substrate-binding protein